MVTPLVDGDPVLCHCKFFLAAVAMVIDLQ